MKTRERTKVLGNDIFYMAFTSLILHPSLNPVSHGKGQPKAGSYAPIGLFFIRCHFQRE